MGELHGKTKDGVFEYGRPNQLTLGDGGAKKVPNLCSSRGNYVVCKQREIRHKPQNTHHFIFFGLLFWLSGCPFLIEFPSDHGLFIRFLFQLTHRRSRPHSPFHHIFPSPLSFHSCFFCCRSVWLRNPPIEGIHFGVPLPIGPTTLPTMSSYRGRGRIRDPTIMALICADESEHGGFNILSVTPHHCIFCPLIFL